MQNRRKSNRISTNFPIIYVVPNLNGRVETQGLGVVLDISTDGIMFESNEPIEATNLYIRASGSDGSPMKIEGTLVYSMPYFNGKYRSGISFKGSSDQVSNFVNEVLSSPI